MIYFTTIFGDTPLSVYGIYVVLHVTYGRTYVEALYDDGFSFQVGSGWDFIGRGLMSSPGRITWGCHGVTAWFTQANTSVGQYYFHVLITYIRIYCHNGFSLDSDDHKNKWSRQRSFLYGCDQSYEMRVLKLRTKIPNLNTKWLVYEIDLEILSPEYNYAWGRISTLTTPVRKRYQIDTYYLPN